MTMTLDHRLDRTISIEAPRETVFRYFTDSERWATWWGAGSTIDPRPGGRVYIRYPNGVEVSGEVMEVAAPDRIVFTYGYASGDPFPPGASRVTIALAAHDDGTRLQLAHELPTAAARDHHVQGWRYQLSVFANVVADAVHADLASRVDRWFAMWAEPDEATRERVLRELAAPDLRYRDRFSCTFGIEDLLPHIAATQRFMPAMRLRRLGAPRHCQGLALVDWVIEGDGGAERGRGTSAFRLDPSSRIQAVTGFWNAPSA